MKPITFVCEATLSLPAEEIARRILNAAYWPDFHGYGPIPGIKAAEFEVRTPALVGTRIRVTNTDGSTHVEEIVEWQPGQRLRLEFKDFSPPLSRLAAGMEETWEFPPTANATRVIRTFKMHARSALTWPILLMISYFLRRAILRHLRELR
jgi:hypothetical protein